MPDRHPLGTVAGMRRELVPGTTIRLTNHIRPDASRITVVLPKTNTRDLVTHAIDKHGKDVESHLSWPKAADVTGDERDPRTVHLSYLDTRSGDRSPFVTITVLEPGR